MKDTSSIEAGENGFAERLRGAMKDSRHSHRSLAVAIGASKQSVTNWTRGHNEPSLRRLRDLARELKTTPAALLEDGKALPPVEPGGATLLRELVSEPIGPAIRAVSTAAPDLLELLGRAERCVKELEDSGED